MSEQTVDTQVVVIGAGPAGYAAAFRCADLGLRTVLVERYASLGGVCLNVGCIPSKALLHVAKLIEDARNAAACGVNLGEPEVDLDRVREWKGKVVAQLTGGLMGMAKQRKVEVVRGTAAFVDPHTLEVQGDAPRRIRFDHAIVAVGSSPVRLPFVPHEDPRVWDSTDALNLPFVPGRLLVVGGGIIGLEMGTVYRALGSRVDVVEMSDQLVPAADKDVVGLYVRAVKNAFHLMVETRVTAVDARDDGLWVTFEGKAAPAEPQRYDAALVAVGRAPSGHAVGADKAGVAVTDKGFIEVDAHMRTNVPHILAVGDVTGQPMLAHKGAHQGHVAAEVVAGEKAFFAPKVIPSVMYTHPEVAWAGMTEKEATDRGVPYETAVFPWQALGRAIAAEAKTGMTKLLVHKENRRVLGGAVVGENASELLGEIALAVEMGADVEDVALTIHAHPSLHESVGLAAEVGAGTITDLPNKKARRT